MKKFPTVESVSYCCFGKKHKVGCGCITNSFIQAAKRNLYCAIMQCGNNVSSFAERMHNFSRYHARGTHKWSGGQCNLHPLVACSCGECRSTEELKCNGKKRYMYVKECSSLRPSRSCIQDWVLSLGWPSQCSIRPWFWRGHRNACESTFSVLTKFWSRTPTCTRYIVNCQPILGLLSQVCPTVTARVEVLITGLWNCTEESAFLSRTEWEKLWVFWCT